MTKQDIETSFGEQTIFAEGPVDGICERCGDSAMTFVTLTNLVEYKSCANCLRAKRVVDFFLEKKKPSFVQFARWAAPWGSGVSVGIANYEEFLKHRKKPEPDGKHYDEWLKRRQCR